MIRRFFKIRRSNVDPTRLAKRSLVLISRYPTALHIHDVANVIDIETFLHLSVPERTGSSSTARKEARGFMRFSRIAMRKSKRPKQIPSTKHEENTGYPSPRCSTVLFDWDADDEFMSSGDNLPSRPLSLAIPSGPYCPQRPTLREVLANSAPPPWTLSAFMAYLSQNHCLETLEFTMDASRYRKHYETLRENSRGLLITPSTEGCEYVRMLWQKLLDAYITPNGPREVNLPSNVRDSLVSAPNHFTPPHPSQLDTAVRIVYDLMEESVLVPFLNSVSVTRSSTTYSSPYASTDDMSSMLNQESRDNRSGSSSQSGYGSSNRDTQNYSGPLRPSQPSHLALALKRGLGSAYTSSTTSSTEGNEDSYTDDSMSTADSPTSLGEPMTPPITPPTSDSFDASDSSPKAKNDESAWKKMGFKWGLRKTRPSHTSESSTSTSSYPHAPRRTNTQYNPSSSSYPHAPRTSGHSQ